MDVYSEENSFRFFLLNRNSDDHELLKRTVRKIHFYYRPAQNEPHVEIDDYHNTRGEYVIEENREIMELLEKICFSRTDEKVKEKRDGIKRGILHIIFEFEKSKTKAGYIFLDYGRKSLSPIHGGWDFVGSRHVSFCDWLQDTYPQIFKNGL
jgi:hypothetical protein